LASYEVDKWTLDARVSLKTTGSEGVNTQPFNNKMMQSPGPYFEEKP